MRPSRRSSADGPPFRRASALEHLTDWLATRPVAVALGVALGSLALLSAPTAPERRAPIAPETPIPREPPPLADRTTLTAPRPASARADAAATAGAPAPPPAVAPPAPGPIHPEPPAAAAPGEPAAARLTLRVLDELGTAAPGALVEIRPDPSDGPPRRVATGADGGWSGAVAPGRLVAVAWTEACTSASVEVELAAGSEAAATLTLRRARPVAGRVVDAATGQPVAGARVAFWTHAELDVVRTDATGTFLHPRFPAPGETHQVRVEAAGYGAEVRFLRIDGTGAGALLAATEHGAEAPPREPSTRERGRVVLELVPAVAVRGRVVGPDGAPVAGASVSATGHFAILPGVGSSDCARTETDALGHFELAGLRSDVSHAVSVRAPGVARVGRVAPPAPGRVRDLGDVALDPELRLGGAVVDAGGHPVEGVRVSLRGRSPRPPVPIGAVRDLGAPLRGLRDDARTDVGGAFGFAQLPADEYTVTVRDGRRTLFEEEFALHRAPRTTLVLRLPPEAAVLTGTVRSAQGPVPGARVDLVRAGSRRTVTTDTGGGFRASGVDAASGYELHVRARAADGAFLETRVADVWAGAHASVELAAAP